MSNLIGLATLVGVLAAALQLTALRKQRRRAFEDFFVHRYWKIMDDLSLEGLTGKRPDTDDVQPGDEKAVIAFLRLSEDEADLRAKGWISKGTWELWWEGMATQLHRWPFDEVWAKVCSNEDEAEPEDQFRTLRGACVQIREQTAFDPGPRWRGPFGGP